MEKFEFTTGSIFVGNREEDCVLLFELSKKPVVGPFPQKPNISR